MRKNSILKLLPVLGIALALSGVPVKAATSTLDVKAGDIYSFYTYKDSASDKWENLYYVTPTTYKGGGIMGNSVSQQGNIASGYTLLYDYKRAYSYGSDMVAVGGIYYRLVTGPTSYATPDWHLVGRYTP